MPFELTEKQQEAMRVLARPAEEILFYGGSRSTKTFTLCRAIALRAMKAPGSRHAILRFHFNHVKSSIVFDTWPKMMELAFPGAPWHLNKSDWFITMGDGAEVWFGGLDEKDRTEKILGNEYVTILLNEISQIPYSSYLIAQTRLAQSVMANYVNGGKRLMPPKMYLDENPPSKGHWSYKLFVKKQDPETGRAIINPQHYEVLQMNPKDNEANLPASYLKKLENMPTRMRKRFYDGEFADTDQNALWRDETFDRYRVIDDPVPEYQRIVIGVDPSGAGDHDNADNDAVGIVVAALGVDGCVYVLEDLTIKAGPSTWGNVVGSAFDRLGADRVVAETNYGGAMVEHVIRSARPGTPYTAVTASRGKVVRAEPISVLYEQGKVKHVGHFPDLEAELCAFSTTGYTGETSPNRADALVWAVSALFPAVVKPVKEKTKTRRVHVNAGTYGWMAS